MDANGTRNGMEMEMTDVTAFDAALEDFRACSDETLKAHFAREGYTFAIPFVEVASIGKKYAKLHRGERDPVTDELWPSGSVHAFVSIETGEIFMAAGTSRPAKHARGSIYTNRGADALTDTGSVKYLR